MHLINTTNRIELLIKFYKWLGKIINYLVQIIKICVQFCYVLYYSQHNQTFFFLLPL